MYRFVLTVLIAVCPLMGRQPPAPKPNVPVPPRFENESSEAASTSAGQWWKAFGDPLLDELLARIFRANLDVRKAGARLAEASALRGGVKSELLPTVDGGASGVQLRGGYNQGVVHLPNTPGATPGGSFVSAFESGLVSTGLTSRWELDIFRGIRKSLEAERANERSALEDIHQLQLLVRAELARDYIEMRSAEEQIEIVKAHQQSEEELLVLVRARAEAGLASDLDVDRQIVQLTSVRAGIADLDVQRLRCAHRIAVLVGEYPAALVERLSMAPHPKLAAPPVPVAVPSEVLRQRPDLIRADAAIEAAYARAGAARADLFPKVVITGLSGRQATDLSGFTLGAGNFFSIGPGISLPIFNFGRIRSNIAARDAQLEQAIRDYEQQVLTAFEETENAFVARDRAERRRRELGEGLAAARRSLQRAQELYVSGLADFLTVLDAQRQQFQIERELAASDASVLVGTVMLYKALGE